MKFIWIKAVLIFFFLCTLNYDPNNIYASEIYDNKSELKKSQKVILGACVSLLIATSATGAYYIHKYYKNLNPNETSNDSLYELDDGMDLDSNFTISLVNMGTNSDYDEAFIKAKKRWSSIIVNDLDDVKTKEKGIKDLFNGYLDDPYDEDVDDVVIGYKIGKIDGKNKTLGFAGPTMARKNYTAALAGVMIFDEEDFSEMSEENREIIILHEMGHVFGIGTFWPFKCGTGCGFGSYAYECAKAQRLYDGLSIDSMLRIENDGDIDTKCSHWDESSFFYSDHSELMTGYFESNKFQPLSVVTAAALEDFGGYEVNYAATDPLPAEMLNEFISASFIHMSPEPLRASSTFSLEGLIETPQVQVLD